MDLSIVSEIPFPQTGANSTRDELILEILEHTGGTERPESQLTAGRSLDRAVRHYNRYGWKFQTISQDIALASPDAGTVADYTLNANIRLPVRAVLVDSETPPRPRQKVFWVKWDEWIFRRPSQTGTGSSPSFYTIRNRHLNGVMTIDPPPAINLTYPTMRLHYVSPIAFAAGRNGKLNVPEEIEEAILTLALANNLRKSKSFRDAANARRDALFDREELAVEYREFGDIPVMGF